MTAPVHPAVAAAAKLHDPVLLTEVVAVLNPRPGSVIVDGTFGAGGYSRALLELGAQVTGIDRDPEAIARARNWAGVYDGRLRLVPGCFGNMDRLLPELHPDGVVLDIGVSSMQIDVAERGFSFMRDGPLDMRMGGDGPDAATLVNTLSEGALADILYHYGEERAARRIARAIVQARATQPFTTTLQLADCVVRCLPKPKPGDIHPATRSFQALRIAVNDELGELVRGLLAAERMLKPGGVLAVVSFHSLEDRIVKRFFQLRGDHAPQGSRHLPLTDAAPPCFTVPQRKPIEAGAAELARNPRARSARLRWGLRTDAPPAGVDLAALGLPDLTQAGRGRRS